MFARVCSPVEDCDSSWLEEDRRLAALDVLTSCLGWRDGVALNIAE